MDKGEEAILLKERVVVGFSCQIDTIKTHIGRELSRSCWPLDTSLWEGYLDCVVGSRKPCSMGVAPITGGGPGLSRKGKLSQGQAWCVTSLLSALYWM